VVKFPQEFNERSRKSIRHSQFFAAKRRGAEKILGVAHPTFLQILDYYPGAA
jgi:hypothetical protein